MDLETTEKALRKIIKEELFKSHTCRFDISDDQAKEITQHLSGITDLGNGSVQQGMKEMQANHRYTYRQRKFRDNVANKIGMAVIGIFCLGFMYALWEGLKHFLGKG